VLFVPAKVHNLDSQCLWGKQPVKRSDWATKTKLILVEVSSVLSIAMLLAWLLWEEFRYLFRK